VSCLLSPCDHSWRRQAAPRTTAARQPVDSTQPNSVPRPGANHGPVESTGSGGEPSAADIWRAPRAISRAEEIGHEVSRAAGHINKHSAPARRFGLTTNGRPLPLSAAAGPGADKEVASPSFTVHHTKRPVRCQGRQKRYLGKGSKTRIDSSSRKPSSSTDPNLAISRRHHQTPGLVAAAKIENSCACCPLQEGPAAIRQSLART
jgi:hypothetical protein